MLADASPGELTVDAMARRLTAAGVRLTGRPSKVVSDALCTGARRGRVVRVGRGRYRFGRAPESSLRRWRLRSAGILRGDPLCTIDERCHRMPAAEARARGATRIRPMVVEEP